MAATPRDFAGYWPLRLTQDDAPPPTTSPRPPKKCRPADRTISAMDIPRVAHRFVEVEGVRVFYREAGPLDAPVLLLLHGFPSASHQYRRLIDALGTRYRVIAPDYPGFGHTEAPRGSPTPSTGSPTSPRASSSGSGWPGS